MPKNNYAEDINSTKLMVAGLKQYSGRIAKRGIDANFIDQLDAMREAVSGLDVEQEDLKAKLKRKTAMLNEARKDMKKKMSEAKKAVKLEMEQETWKTFGIQDMR